MTARKFYVLTATVGAALILLLALGVWQVQRLHWKQNLLDTLAARARAEPVSLDTAIRRAAGNAEDIRFLRVRVDGRYWHDREMHLYGIYDKQPVWRIITPLTTPSGEQVLIIRGVVPQALEQQESRTSGLPQGEVSVVGQVRLGEARSIFYPDNAPEKNKWYWRDIDAMKAAAFAGKTGRTADFFVELDAPDSDAKWPKPAPVTAASLPNRHLGYALTWFGLAAGLLGVYGFTLRTRMKT